MADFAYALHTDACTYLLDETGVCQWVLSPNPSTASVVQACVGAQFVASLDSRVQGNLTSELVPGASALFATVSKDTGRPILLRTGPILRVQIRTGESDGVSEPLPGEKRAAAEPSAAAADKPGASKLRRKSDARKLPPLPKRGAQPSVPETVLTQPKGMGKWIAPVRDSAPTTRRKVEPDESSITLVTYPGVALPPKDEAMPLLLKNKKKKA